MIKFKGTVLSLHPLFVIVMLASVFTGRFLELLTLFIIVFIHELGHAAAAAAMGFKVRAIQMLPFGGVAVIEDDGRMTAMKEIIIALAGPLQNVIMIGITLACQWAGWGDEQLLSYIIQGISSSRCLTCFRFCRWTAAKCCRPSLACLLLIMPPCCGLPGPGFCAA